MPTRPKQRKTRSCHFLRNLEQLNRGIPDCRNCCCFDNLCLDVHFLLSLMVIFFTTIDPPEVTWIS